MFQKKQKVRLLDDSVYPDYQYINIYKTTAKRLSTFSNIQLLDQYQEGEGDYHYGDAASYEQFLEYAIKTKKNV